MEISITEIQEKVHCTRKSSSKSEGQGESQRRTERARLWGRAASTPERTEAGWAAPPDWGTPIKGHRKHLGGGLSQNVKRLSDMANAGSRIWNSPGSCGRLVPRGARVGAPGSQCPPHTAERTTCVTSFHTNSWSRVSLRYGVRRAVTSFSRRYSGHRWDRSTPCP